MSSINTNTQAMNALSTLRDVNKNLSTTQERISTGLKISSAKDNAAYFSISETMKGDSAMYNSIQEGLTLTANSLKTARLGAETFVDMIGEFTEQVAFGQAGAMNHADIQKQLGELVSQLKTVLDQSTFNGENWVDGTRVDGTYTGLVADANSVAPGGAGYIPTQGDVNGVPVNVVTGVGREGATLKVTKMEVAGVDLKGIVDRLSKIDITTGQVTTAPGAPLTGADLETARNAILTAANTELKAAITAATDLGLSEKSVETQQEYLKKLTDTIDTGVGAMVDADMEAEAARLQALQVQQQLATQALSIANQAPQNLVSLFR
ncbi:flagellin N-terminal helical domain-containing protein [Falsigemmobacter intermedius]|uniref:flagellin N-terminal helical domain-containing protein n=1 Tax=Falsigemmobacter intermedius TaxID=1553448 RepID=UPI003F0369DF